MQYADDKIINHMLQKFLKEIVLLQVGAENLSSFTNITNFLENNRVDYANLPLPIANLIDILNTSRPNVRKEI